MICIESALSTIYIVHVSARIEGHLVNVLDKVADQKLPRLGKWTHRRIDLCKSGSPGLGGGESDNAVIALYRVYKHRRDLKFVLYNSQITMANEESQIPEWQELVARKRQECQQKIPSEWTLSAELLKAPPHLLEYDVPRRSGILSKLELDLTENYTATQLLAKLASGQTSSLALTTALCKRAAIAQQLVSLFLSLVN